jgi:hypothetical protein
MTTPRGSRWSRGFRALLLLREAEREFGVCRPLAEAMRDRRDPDRVRHAMFEMVMARSSAIACRHKDANDLDRLRHDPLMKITVGRCPQSGAALASQSTISREAVRLCAALVDQFGETIKPGALEILDIDDTFCAVHGGQQLAFWNAHHEERGFASMHIYDVASSTPIATHVVGKVLQADFGFRPRDADTPLPGRARIGFDRFVGVAH